MSSPTTSHRVRTHVAEPIALQACWACGCPNAAREGRLTCADHRGLERVVQGFQKSLREGRGASS